MINKPDELDQLLQSDWLRPPADFTQRVMQRIAPIAPIAPQPHRARGHALQKLLATASLIGAGLLGLTQLAGFVFGLWVSSTAL